MSHHLDVYVVDSDHDPVSGTRVEVLIEGFWKGGSIRSFTDDGGHAEFDTADDYESYRKVRIHVRGQWFGPYEIGGGDYTVQVE
jgi:hypothetical protein